MITSSNVVHLEGSESIAMECRTTTKVRVHPGGAAGWFNVSAIVPAQSRLSASPLMFAAGVLFTRTDWPGQLGAICGTANWPHPQIQLESLQWRAEHSKNSPHEFSLNALLLSKGVKQQHSILWACFTVHKSALAASVRENLWEMLTFSQKGKSLVDNILVFILFHSLII